MKLLLKYIFLAISFVTVFNNTHAQVKISEQENLNTPVTLEFLCQGNYLEIMGNKYYEGDAAYVCSSDFSTLGLLRYDNQQFRQKFQRPAQMPATKL